MGLLGRSTLCPAGGALLLLLLLPVLTSSAQIHRFDFSQLNYCNVMIQFDVSEYKVDLWIYLE